MNFLAAVNRVLRNVGILRGDDDDLTSFAQTQHSATLNLAKIAIQDQLTSLLAEQFIPYEEAQGTLTMVQAQRLYSFASDFVRLQEGYLLEVDGTGASQNVVLIEYPGGESQLRADIWEYQETQGTPVWFYHTGGTTKQLGVQPIPDADAAGKQYRYYYEKDVSVTDATDTLPFHSEIEAETFVRVAARHFEMLFEGVSERSQIERDPVLLVLRATLLELMNPHVLKERYGK